MWGVFCQLANILDCVLVKLINSHIETNIVRCSTFNIEKDRVESIASNCIMMLSVPIYAKKDQVSLGKIERKSAVSDHIYNEKSHSFCFDNKVSKALFAVLPNKCFTTAKKENADTHGV